MTASNFNILTEYKIQDRVGQTRTFGSGFTVDRPEDIDKVIQLRGLDETHVGYGPTDLKRPSELIEQGKLEEALHASAFMCYLGLNSGILEAEEGLGDYGLVHELIHLDQGITDGQSLHEIKLLSEEIENKLEKICF